MEFRTKVETQRADFSIEPQTEMLFVGSCFADNIGKRFQDNAFRAIVNPFGVMYNPASIFHTLSQPLTANSQYPRSNNQYPNANIQPPSHILFLTLGTNHIYRLKETGEIVDNCQKRPSTLFQEEELSVDECAEWLQKSIDLWINEQGAESKVVLTVSPIRYAKYGYHESQLSKSTLLLAADKVVKANKNVTYFPAYEIMNDELRDYRFWKPDMLHPSEQAVDYIWEQMVETFFSQSAIDFMKEWKPIRDALDHKPFHPESEEYQTFLANAMAQKSKFFEKWNA